MFDLEDASLAIPFKPFKPIGLSPFDGVKNHLAFDSVKSRSHILGVKG